VRLKDGEPESWEARKLVSPKAGGGGSLQD